MNSSPQSPAKVNELDAAPPAQPPASVGPATEHQRHLLDALALWPVVCLATLGLLAGTVAALRHPLGPLSLFIILAMLVPLVVGVRRAVRARAAWRLGLLVLLPAVCAVWLVSWDFTGHVLPDTPSFSPDAWAYNAIADYIEHYPRGQDHGMNALDQYGSLHEGDRLLSTATLAVLRHTLGSVSAANYLFIAGCLLGHFLSMFFFAHALLKQRGLALAAAFLSTVTGWVCDAIMLGNYDNLFFLAFSPAVLGIAVRFVNQTPETGWSLTPGFRWSVLPPALFMAAIFYGYPEGAAVTAILALPLAIALVGSCWSSSGSRATRVMTLAAIGGLTVLLVLPDVPLFIAFLHRQMAAGLDTQGGRPGEGLVPGLLQARFLPSLFALGDESPQAAYGWVDLLAAAALLLLTLIGAIHIGRRHRWFPWVGVVLLLLCGWMGTLKHYDYALYKIIFCGCWWVYPCIVAGFWRLTEGPPRYSLPLRVGCAVALVTAVTWVRIGDRPLRVLPPGSYTMGALLDLRAVPALIGESPLLVDLDNQLDELWAVFYLRRLHLIPVGPSNYLESARASLAQGRDGRLQISDCRYRLVSGIRPQAIWHDARSSLIPVESALISRIDNPPNNEDHLGNERVFWLGTQPLLLTIQVAKGGTYELHSGRVILGPSLPESPIRHVQVTDADSVKIVVIDAHTTSIPLHLRQGENHVELRCLDKPTVRGLPSGDTRELLLALSDLAATEAAAN